MNTKEIAELNKLRDRYNTSACYKAQDDAWEALQHLAEKHGYGSRFCSLNDAMRWLMTSQSEQVRDRALHLYSAYHVAVANCDTAVHIGQFVANIERDTKTRAVIMVDGEELCELLIG